MKAFDAYKLYVAVKNHMERDTYDFFKYNGATKASGNSFDARRDKSSFVKISRQRNPTNFVIGNILFNPDNWVGHFTIEYQTEFEKYLETGKYIFEQELKVLKPTFQDNFTVDSNNSMPYVIQLFRNGKISLFTMCVFEVLLGCDARWKKTDQYLIFGKISRKIAKAAGFFAISKDKYKVIVLKHFEQLTS